MSDDKIDIDAAAEKNWTSVINSTSSPLKLFALIVLVCNSIFAVAAATALGSEEFIFTLHTFLAVVGAFSMIALWSPRSFYAPHELAQLMELERRYDDKPIFSLVSRIVPTVTTLIVIGIYAAYQAGR